MLARKSSEDDLTAGRLRHVLPLWQARPIPVYAITETRLLPAKTKCFIEYLKELILPGSDTAIGGNIAL